MNAFLFSTSINLFLLHPFLFTMMLHLPPPPAYHIPLTPLTPISTTFHFENLSLSGPFLSSPPLSLPLLSSVAPHGWVTLPMKRGQLAWSLHSTRMKGCRAVKVGKERAKEREEAAAASTPLSDSVSVARWRASDRAAGMSVSSGNTPHKLGALKSSPSPEGGMGKKR